MEQILVSRPDAAKALNISVDTLDRLSNAGHIQKLKIGAKTCYSQDEIIRFANKLIRKGAIYIA